MSIVTDKDGDEWDVSDPEELIDFLDTEVTCPNCNERNVGYDNDGKLRDHPIVVAELFGYGKVTVWCKACEIDLTAHVRKALDLPADAALYARPSFDVSGTQMDAARAGLRAVPQAEGPDHRTFRYGEALVSVGPKGTVKPITAKLLRIALSEVARWQTARGYTDAPMGTTIAALELAGDIGNGMPELDRVVTVPTLLDDGRILSTPGYDAGSCTYYLPAVHGIEVPDVVDRADVDAALSLILDTLLADFPFKDDADQAHALSLLLLGFVRDLIDGPTPLHWIGAPKSRTGKGKLASCLLAPALGTVSSTALPEQEGERQKTISTELSLGVGAIKWDNVRGDVRSQALELALTETRWNARRLGFNFGPGAIIDVPIFVSWVLTANNATPGGDMKGRTLPITLDREVEEPGRWQPADGWRLDRPPEVWALDHRAELARAALVLCRWWHQQGRPAGKPAAVLGGYEEWQRVLGGILQAAGVDGFCSNLLDLDDADEDRAEVHQVFTALAAAYGNTPKTAAEILADRTLSELWPDTASAKGMGRKLQTLKDNRAAGYVLRQVRTRAANMWRVMET